MELTKEIKQQIKDLVINDLKLSDGTLPPDLVVDEVLKKYCQKYKDGQLDLGGN
jgi:hypothetical protein